MAHYIARPAARRARMIMAIRTAYQRAAAHQARGYEMPLRGIFEPLGGGAFIQKQRETSKK